MMKRRFITKVLSGICVTTVIIGALMIPVHATNVSIIDGETPSGIPFSSMEQEIDEYVSAYIGKTTPGAAIAVVKDGEIIFSKGYGYADVENEIHVDPQNTVFEWASASKLFTWTSVMQLVEQGKIDLDTELAAYLPREFTEKLEYQQPITMRDVMNHAAGFGDYAFNVIVFSEDQLVSLEEAILRDKPEQYYEVGTASAYSNYATSLAGYVVQTVSGMSIDDYEREEIFNVLLMENTSANPTSEDNKRILNNKAQGYLPLPDQQGGFQPGNWSYVSHLPAGSINGTVVDFAKFAMALTPGEGEQSPLFRQSDTLSTMLSPSYDPLGDMKGTAHGFFEYVGEQPTFGHGGNTAAFSSQFAIVPEERFGIVILTNAYLEMDLLFGLQDLLLGRGLADIKIPDEDLPSSNKVAGMYVPMERQVGNFLDFAKYLGLYKVKAAGENQITMNIGAYQGTYLQTGPYHYELVDDNIPLFKNIYPILRFKVENDTVKQIAVGNGMDLSPLPQGRTVPFLVGSFSLLLINMLFFFITPVALLVVAVRRRKTTMKSATATMEDATKEPASMEPDKKRLYLHQLAFLLFGTVIIINNLIPVAKIMTSSFRTYSEMKPYILFNYPLLAGTIVTAMFSVHWMKKRPEVRLKEKALFMTTLILLMSLVGLFWHWNFFSLVG